jgi:hypothetical protein
MSNHALPAALYNPVDFARRPRSSVVQFIGEEQSTLERSFGTGRNNRGILHCEENVIAGATFQVGEVEDPNFNASLTKDVVR